jgi:hypothetical protein
VFFEISEENFQALLKPLLLMINTPVQKVKSAGNESESDNVNICTCIDFCMPHIFVIFFSAIGEGSR